MATKLEKDITRESTVEVEGRNVLVTITQDQKVSVKLKGMRTGAKSIDIEDLYEQLNEGISGSKPKAAGKGINIDLHDLRTRNAISGLPYDDKVKFDMIITSLIKNI